MQDYTVTRWWCVRHALVPESAHKGKFYGGQDVDCQPCDIKSKWLARTLPQNASLITSDLRRTHQTADAIALHGLSMQPRKQHADLNEQSFGDWEQRKITEVYGDRTNPFWWSPAHTRAGGGESFADLYARVSDCITGINNTHAGKDIIAITHGGTIRAMVALALKIPMDNALNVTIDNQSLTLLEHFHAEGTDTWRAVYINKLGEDTQ